MWKVFIKMSDRCFVNKLGICNSRHMYRSLYIYYILTCALSYPIRTIDRLLDQRIAAATPVVYEPRPGVSAPSTQHYHQLEPLYIIGHT